MNVGLRSRNKLLLFTFINRILKSRFYYFGFSQGFLSHNLHFSYIVTFKQRYINLITRGFKGWIFMIDKIRLNYLFGLSNGHWKYLLDKKNFVVLLFFMQIRSMCYFRPFSFVKGFAPPLNSLRQSYVKREII